MEWEYEEDTKVVVAKLKQEGYKIFAVEQVQNSIMLDRVELDKTNKYVLNDIVGKNGLEAQMELDLSGEKCGRLADYYSGSTSCRTVQNARNI